MPSPTRKPQLQRALMKKLKGALPGETKQSRKRLVGCVLSHYREDDIQPRRPWIVQDQVLGQAVPGAPPKVFAVVRQGEYVVKESEVYPCQWEPPGSNTEARARAIFSALNEHEQAAERE